MAGKAVWEVRFDQTGILAARAGRFLSCAPVWVPQHFLLGCTHLTKHVIKVTDDVLSKEWFMWIPPLMVEDVNAHLWQMLDSGMIHYSQSVWCNAVVLVQKNYRSLCFCIDFCHLNAWTKKDSYQLPRIQDAPGSLVGAGHFSSLDMKSRFWQIKMDEQWKQYNVFTVGKLGFFKVTTCLLGWQCTSHVWEVNSELPWGAESNTLPHLPWRHNCFLTDSWGMPPLLTHHLWPI